MTNRVLAAAAILGLGLSTLAQAQPGAAAQAKPAEQRTARYAGGEGATWKVGRDTHGFSGTYGGCRYSGVAGPNGYRLDRSC